MSATDKNGSVKREFDALNRVIKYTDTYGNTIGYRYDSIGNLSAIVYPDGTEVTYEYDVTNNPVSVTDWEDRKTVYTYDENNRAVGVIKPDGSTTTTVYDNAGRVTSSVEKNARGVIITGFEYTYDILGRVSTEKRLDKNLEICYTYDRLSRVTLRTVTDLATCNSSQETFNYDSAGNILYSATNSDYSAYTYDSNNRLISYNGTAVTYDADGNMTSAYLDCTGELFRYDSTNRLVGTNTNAYTYNAENVRIRNLCGESETTYAYDNNAKLSRLLVKTTDGRITKYVYGRGLIGEETDCVFKTYHFDYRGSTVAITDINGNVTDTFEYDTYGKLTARTGSSDIIFLYNGRDGVVTDGNGLIYMRARYYAPELRRFINADILAGDIANGITLNRYAYANANPVSMIDPRGLAAERGNEDIRTALNTNVNPVSLIDFMAADAEKEKVVSYNQAVLVTRFDDEGLHIVGHTQLYFLGDDGIWYYTEFTTSGGDSIKEMMDNARIYWGVRTPPVYDTKTGEFKDVKGSNYVVLNGNFNDSVARAKEFYENQDFGEYNFVFNNCSDYTDAILDVAEVEGYFSQRMIDGDSLISVPAIREAEASFWSGVDSALNTIKEVGKKIIDSIIFWD